MDNPTSTARTLVESIRYADDSLRYSGEVSSSDTKRILQSIYQSNLRISPAVTPGLSKCVDKVCHRLHIPNNTVHAFVYASSDIQGECFAGNTQECILRFSSSLIDLLDEYEFMFVVGHEIGHFLLGHGISRAENTTDSIEYKIQQRAQEISSDRVGLISCGSLEVAVRAMMKTVSGLTSGHLRFDVSAFLRQLDAVSETGLYSMSTHPSIFVRCRALLWFSLNDAFNRGEGDYCNAELLRLDKKIRKDIDKFVDGPAREMIVDAKDDLLLWVIANHVIQDGLLEKREQELIAELVGNSNLESLKAFLSDVPNFEVQDVVYQKLSAAREALERMIPSIFESEYRDIEGRVLGLFGSGNSDK